MAISLVAVAAALTYYRIADPPVTGDEPHYLVYGRSLAEGWGVDLTEAYKPANRRVFYGGELGPHGRRYTGELGPLATWHSIGLPALIAPALKIRPTIWAARIVLLLIYGILVYQLYWLTLTLTRLPEGAVALAVLLIAITTPMISYAGQIFPELVAGLLVVISLRLLMAKAQASIRYGGAAVAAAMLLWLGPRYAVLTATLLGITALAALLGSERWQGAISSLMPAIILAAVIGGLLVIFNLEVYGSLLPSEFLAPRELSHYELDNLYLYGLGGIFGIPGGLIPYAPIIALAVVALPITSYVIGRNRMIAGLAIVIPYVGLNAFFGSPGYAPPGRYFVSIVPLLTIPLAVAISLGGGFIRSAAALLGLLSIVGTVTSAQHFERLYTLRVESLQPVDGTKNLYPYVLDDHRPNRFSLPATNISHDVGRLEHEEGGLLLVARSPRDVPGFLTFGPYISLQPGRYAGRFELWGGENGTEDTSGLIEVVEVGGKRLATRPIHNLSSGNESVVLNFVTDGEVLLEFRVHFVEGVIGVLSVEAELLEPFATRRAREEWWKAVLWIGGLGSLAFSWLMRYRFVHGTADTMTFSAH